MIRFLIEKEFKQIIRNKFVTKVIIMMPVMIMLIMPWAANLEIKDLNLCIIDNDHSSYSQRLIQKTVSSGYFRLTNVSFSHNEAMQSIEKGEADLILEIQNDFEKDLIKEGISKIMISVNAVNGTKAGLGTSYLGTIVNNFSNEIRSEQVQISGNAAIPIINIVSQNRYNAHLNYKAFMVPALMVILLTLLCGFLPALNIVNEKEVGTIEQINVTPVSKFTFILGKLIPYWIIGFIALTSCLLIAAFLYKLIPVGNILTIYLFTSIYILVVSGLGLVISNFSNTMQQAMFVMFFFIIIFILMSGVFTPVSSMPQWAQNITIFNPLKYFIEVLRAIFLKGSGIKELSHQLIALVSFATAFYTLAVLSYRKSS